MKFKAILWACGTIATATGLVLGIRSAARAIGIDGSYQISHPVLHDQQRVVGWSVSDDAFSPDAFRDELLK
jgi:hypothetical protein